jgi:hypothetical protein
MGILEQARKYRAIIEGAMALTDDKTASEAPELSQAMRTDGSLVKAGTRINWHGTIKRAAVDLWATAENDPDHSPALWEDIAYRDGFRIIPEVITSTLAFSAGEYGWWGDTLYRSKVNGNAHNPSLVPENWEPV